MADDSFRDLQLNGKQVVFLFMAGTAAAVVIFLCGVMVGRGVRLQRGTLALQQAMADPTAVEAPPITSTAPDGGASPAKDETLSYPGRLSSDAPAPEALSEPIPDAAPVPPGASAPDPTHPAKPDAPDPTVMPKASKAEAKASKDAKDAKPPAPTAAAAAAAPPEAKDAPDAYTVQVSAIKERADADKIVKRLTAKGYAAYISTPPPGSPRVFRVRVGKFKDRREAEAMASRLEKEEQMKPWVTR